MNFQDIQNQWPKAKELIDHPVAYLCAEFALSDELPIYSGGLGVLAGDVIREANVANIPLIGVGLFYKEGYFRQVITEGGLQDELPAYHELTNLPIAIVTDASGAEFRIKMFIGNRIIAVRTWKYMEGNIPVYLLDTDLPENLELDRRLTLSLYPTDNEWRIQQEIILGIGGVKLLHHLGITPGVYHLNEGHSAFAILEIAHKYLKNHAVSFSEALAYARSKTVFTNHTLISSGNDVFSSDTVVRLLKEYADHLELPVDDIVRMGAVPGQESLFSMTHLALSASNRVSAVSKTHAEFAKITWPDRELTPITNGVHAPFWQAPGWQHIADQLARGFDVTDAEVWRTHLQYKAELLAHLERVTPSSFNPEALTVTWARRIAAYKQPLLLFSDIARLKAIIYSNERPVQIVIAGKAHPGDAAAKGMITELLNILKSHDLHDNIVFVPNYNLQLARLLVAGSDVWLNTPIRGQEACGTSGMKSAMNGGLQCAISDGWTDEISLAELGFLVNPVDSATSLYNSLEQAIAPLYYSGQATHGIPVEWVARMKQTAITVTQGFSSERMLREYVERLYVPTLGNG